MDYPFGGVMHFEHILSLPPFFGPGEDEGLGSSASATLQREKMSFRK